MCKTSRHEKEILNLENLPDIDFGNAVDFLGIPGNCCCGWGFNLCIKHLEDTLQWLIIDDSERSVAFENP